MRYFQKKVLYTIRRFGMIKKGDVIMCKRANDFRSVVLEDVLNVVEKKAPVKIVNSSTKKVNKIAVNMTADLVAEEIVKELIKGKIKDVERFAPMNKKEIKPLYLFLDEEVLLYARLRSKFCIPKGMCQHYAKLRKHKFKKERLKVNKIREFIEGLKKKHPEVKHAIVNSYLKII